MDQRKTQAICSAGTSGKRSLSTRYLLGLKNRLSNTDLKMSMKLTRKVKGHFRKRKKDQCCQSVNPGEETGLMEARFSGGPVPGDRKIQHRTLGLRAETVERPRNQSGCPTDSPQPGLSLPETWRGLGTTQRRMLGKLLAHSSEGPWRTRTPHGASLDRAVRPPTSPSGTVDGGEGGSAGSCGEAACSAAPGLGPARLLSNGAQRTQGEQSPGTIKLSQRLGERPCAQHHGSIRSWGDSIDLR